MTACQDPEPSIPTLTGTVSISGTAQPGQTLTANTGNLSGSGTLFYQWKRGGTGGGAAVNIGTGSTYTVQSADESSTITVVVTRSGYSGSVSSGPTALVAFPKLGGTVSIDGIVKVGQTLTANTDSLNGIGDISYQWKRTSTNSGTITNVGGASTYVVRPADPGNTLTVTVTRDGYSGSRTSDPAAVPLPPLTGTITISGTAAVGETLTANTDSLEGGGGFSYEWMRETGGAAIIIGTDSTYVVQTEDLGSTITVTVIQSGYDGSFISDPTAVVTIPLLTGTVTIVGIAEEGQTLTANTDSLNGIGAISYQWKRVAVGGGETNVGNTSTYIVQPADLGNTLTVTVTRDGYSDSVISEPLAVLPRLTGTVTISGNAVAGQTLTAVTTGLDGTGIITYQWTRGGVIPVGINSSIYTLQSADAGFALTVTVTRSGYSGSVTSEPTAVVTLPTLYGTVTISGITQAGQTLTAITTSLGGTGTISYQWKRSGTVNVGTNSNAYVAQVADVGFAITVTVTRSGNSGTVTSNAVTIGPQAYADYIKKVEFTSSMATVTFNNLSNKSLYLVKVNTSASRVTAGNTGSVLSVSPSFLIDNAEPSPLPLIDRPRMGHPAATAMAADTTPLPPESPFRPLADFIPPVVGATRSFNVESNFNNGNFVSRSATLLATETYGNIWVINNGITTAQAQALARNFDIIYPAETNILGFEYGGGPNGNGGKDGDPKIQILVYDFGNSGSNVLGFFWEKDYRDSGLGTNKAEIFYLNASWMRSSPDLIYLTLAHEFQHMINFNRKKVEKGLTSDTWYDETLSMMTEDIMANILGISTTNADHPIRDHVPYFLETYDKVGFSEWEPSDVLNDYSYSKGYTFGAYLMRNFGGADLLRRILASNSVNTASITAALNEVSPGMTFEKAVIRFGEAMIFSGNSKPEGALTFDKTVTSSVSGNNGSHSYTLPAFDIWNTVRYSSSARGPVVYPLAQTTMRGHSVVIQQDSSWINRTGTVSITFNRPSSANIEMYLMVR
jgi:hypothetical protein